MGSFDENDENKSNANKISYVEDSTSERSLDIQILSLFLFIIPFPLVLISFIFGITWALGANSQSAFLVFMGIAVLSWICAPGIWKFKKSAFFLVILGFILAIIASSLSYFEHLLVGPWAPGEDVVYWAGNIELIIYSIGILILLRNRKKFFEFKKY
jgi:hypothetical protein